jgi:hypothetical protein
MKFNSADVEKVTYQREEIPYQDFKIHENRHKFVCFQALPRNFRMVTIEIDGVCKKK